MKFSVTTVLLPQLDLPEQCSLLQRCGYDGMELRVRRTPPERRTEQYSFWGRHKYDLPPDEFVRQAEQIRRIAADHGLTIPVLASNAPASDLEDVKYLAEGAAALGGAMVRLGCPPDPSKSKDYHARYAEAVDAYGKALEITGTLRLRVLIEIHANTIHVSPSMAWRIARNFPAEQIGVIYDLNNMSKIGFEEYDLGLQVLGPYVAHVHCGGWRPIPGEPDETGTIQWTWQGCHPGEGVINVKEAFAALRRHGYEGYVSLEDFRDMDPEAKLREAIDYFHRIDPDRSQA